MRVLALAFMLILTTAASPDLAQEPKKASAWAVEYSETRCTLLRTMGGEAQQTFGIRTIPGNSIHEMIIASAEWSRNPLGNAKSVDIVLAPSGTRRSGLPAVMHTEDGQKPILFVQAVDDTDLDALSSSASIEIASGERSLIAIPLSGTAKAIQALRDCSIKLYKSWGMDPDFLKGLRRPPVGDARSVFRADDYPRAALRRGASGEVIIRYDISPTGTVADCVVVASSGERDLDETTCNVVVKRARFEPGIGADGQPVTVRKITPIRWVIPTNR